MLFVVRCCYALFVVVCCSVLAVADDARCMLFVVWLVVGCRMVCAVGSLLIVV